MSSFHQIAIPDLQGLALATKAGRAALFTKIQKCQEKLSGFSEKQMLRESQRIEFEVRSGQPLTKLIPDAFALVRHATKTVLGIEHYPVQLLAGAKLISRSVIEMDTGEGKTLTALLPLYLLSLRSRGVYLATANDYLASRDAETARSVLSLLGKTVGAITADSSEQQRRDGYQCSITYSTANELGFDLIRDRGWRRAGQLDKCVGRGELHAIIVDEADSLLIDEATTPLVISSPPPQVTRAIKSTYHWANQHAPAARENTEYHYDHRQQKVDLTTVGRRWARSLPLPSDVGQISQLDCFTFLERAIKVRRNFQREQHYVVQDGEVILVDEHTGRFGHGRQWQDGIQQAIQAKENLELSMPNGQMGRMTLQSFFLSFEHLSGMTGTAKQAKREFRKIYRMNYFRVPPNRPSRRRQCPDLFFKEESQKFQVIADEVKTMRKQKRCTLIGTRSIEGSLRLSEVFDANGIPHTVLNATQSSEEAAIVTRAGQSGAVTISTSMAGRGTDIELDDEAREAGGLHVIISELHDSKRIDRQLIGRSARQGDPGSFRRILAGSDEIVRVASGALIGGDVPSKTLRSVASLERAQAVVERRNRVRRKSLFEQEKEQLKNLARAGFDPFLDYVS